MSEIEYPNSRDEFDLLKMSPSAGCGCKFPWDRLSSVMADINHLVTNSASIDGSKNIHSPAWEDAALYDVSPEVTLVSSVDFGTPISSDAAKWGRIATLNALSDVYAMGGTPRFAHSILGWPSNLKTDGIGILTRSAAKALAECSAVLAGGHTITSDVPLFGLAVVGIVNRKHIMRMSSARPGDVLILTKPIGTGIVIGAVKQGLILRAAERKAEAIMMRSNKHASEIAIAMGVRTATDVTGYGLIGHLHNMLVASATAAELDLSSIPIMPEALEILNSHGTVPNSAERSYFALEDAVDWGTAPLDKRIALCDPQTSGGLLLATSEHRAEEFLKRCHSLRQFARVVGHVISGSPGRIGVAT